MARFGFKVFRMRVKQYEPNRYRRWADVPGGFSKHLKDLSAQLLVEQGGEPSTGSGVTLTSEPFAVGASLFDIDQVGPEQSLVSSKAENRQVARWFPLKSHSGGRRISMKFLAGTQGDFDRAIGAGGDLLLAGLAASRPYRAELLTPGTPDQRALLAVESISGYCPKLSLTKLLALGSKRLAQQAKDSEDEVKAWYHLSGNQVTDPGFLADIIHNPESATVVLKHDGTTGSGEKPGAKFRAQWSTLTVEQMNSLQYWLGLTVSERKARSLNGILEIVEPEGSASGYDEGYVSVQADRGRTKIYPDSDVDKFEYPLGSARLSDGAWRNAVRERIELLDESYVW